ncbi:hypothetical protein HOY80DRAFT_1078937, partial [Tuber brumale]
TFDIDSVLAFPTSLAVARLGIKATIAPLRHLNIHSDLHIKIQDPGNSLNHSRSMVPIAEIPHIHLGHLTGGEEYKIYILFPHLMQRERQPNFLRDSEMERFIDHVFLTALEESCPNALIQHFPSSYQMAHLGSLAAGCERQRRYTQAAGRSELILHSIPPEYLHSIWQSMCSLVTQRGLQDFRKPIIFINAKGIKLSSISNSPVTTISRFSKAWGDIIDHIYLDRKAVWGSISTRERQIPQYQWGLTTDIANLTIVPGPNHSARHAGLAYSQFYGTSKEIFDASKVFPFQNSGLEGLAIDTNFFDAWKEIAGHAPCNLEQVHKAYLASKKRAYISLHSSKEKSYGIRQEHRINVQLLEQLFHIIKDNSMQLSQTDGLNLVASPGRDGFLAIPTLQLCNFLESNLNRYCFGFEFLRSSMPDGIDWEKTRIMLMLLRLLKHSFTGSQLSRYPELWENEYGSHSGSNSRIGLNLRSTLPLRGFAFLDTNLIDWNNMQFETSLTLRLGFNIPDVQELHGARRRAIVDATQYYNLFTRAMANLNQNRNNTLLRVLTCWILSCSLIELFRSDIWNTLAIEVLDTIPRESPPLDPRAPLCVPNLRFLFGASLPGFRFVQNYNRHKFHPFERVSYLWDFDQERKRKNWDKKLWRILFQLVSKQLEAIYPDKEFSKLLRQSHFHRVLTHNLIFPQPVNGKYHSKIRNNDGMMQRSWYSALNTTATYHWIAEEWECGSVNPGSFNDHVPQPLPFTRTQLPALIQCVDGQKVLREELLLLKQSEALS